MNYSVPKTKIYTDREVKDLGLNSRDGTMCRIKGCDCGCTVETKLKK